MDLKLNIYDVTGKKIEKTYIASEFDLMWGTMEDLINAVDLDKINDEVAVGKMVLKILPQVKPLLKQVFDGLTDDELKRTKVKELVPVFAETFKYAFSEISMLGNDSGN